VIVVGKTADKTISLTIPKIRLVNVPADIAMADFKTLPCFLEVFFTDLGELDKLSLSKAVYIDLRANSRL
jgi:hypothetical protein